MAQLTIEQALAHAKRLHQAGSLREAEQLYRQVLAQQPSHPDATHYLGLIAHQAGRNDTAAELIRRAIALKPNNAEAHSNLGNVLGILGQTDEAIAAYRQAIVLKPNLLEAHNNLGAKLNEAGQFDEAIAACRQAIVLNPNYAPAHSNLGNALRGKGQLDEAIGAFNRAILLNSAFPEAYNNLGNARRDRGEFERAVAAYRQAIALRPNYAEAYCNLAIAMKNWNKSDEAIAAFRHAIVLMPNYVDALMNLGNALKDKGQVDEAIAAFRQAILLAPKFAEAHNNLGNALKESGQLVEAVVAFRSAIALKPNYPEGHYNLGNALAEQGELDEAADAFRRALALRAGYAEACSNLGVVLKDMGLLDEAIAAYERAIAIDPSYHEGHSNLLFALHFHPDYDAAKLAEEHRRWNRQHGRQPSRPVGAAHSRGAASDDMPAFSATDRNPERRLRIGYVSPDFRNHVVARFFLPILKRHDRSRFEIFLYSNVRKPDSTTDSIRSRADAWRNIAGVTDDAVAEGIREDRIDILVDLAMHTAHNRLLVFARKPAPVQVTYLAYCSTTGLDAIDYRLTDPLLDPPAVSPVDPPAVSAVEPPGETDRYYSEKSVRLPDVYWCYEPDPQASDVAPLPALIAGHVTFGCMNNFAKVSPEALTTWIELLKQMPSSHLAIHARRGAHRGRVFDQLKRNEIDPARLTFIDFQHGQEYFRQYHRIDIALDPFPYAGGTTTCDGMWMGVPAVTLCGRTAVGRSGATLLNSVGLNDLIAKTREEYVRLALKLAADLPRLAELRAGLRERLLKSPLTDAPRFARNVEAAYRQMWRTWTQAPAGKT